MTHRFVALAAILVISGAETAAWAISFSHDQSSHRWTEISGRSGPYKEELLGSAVGLHWLRFYEKSDDARQIWLQYHGLGAPSPIGGTWSGSAHLKLQGGASGDGQTISRSSGYITAIRVCLNDSETKLKGAEIWGAKINTDLSLTTISGSSKFERPHCKVWKKKVSCGPSKVATGIRAYYASYGDSFYGISLRCTKPK